MSNVTVTGFTSFEQNALVATERTASVISVVGCFFVILSFIWSPKFRKPVNRLIFYATWGNLALNVGTLISIDGMLVGYDSALCQIQGFLIQMFLPADAFWNLAMALNTYLTVFRRYNAAKCRAMEKWYLMANLGVFGIIAFVYCFVDGSDGRGKMYGGAVLWCWVRKPWGIWRIITCYGPAWISILISFTIYIASGHRLFVQEKRLAMLGGPRSGSFIENPFTSYKTTEIRITSELADPAGGLQGSRSDQLELQPKSIEQPYAGPPTNFENYSVTIERKTDPIINRQERELNEDEIDLRDAAMRSNKAAKSYTLCCSLFFISLLVTWIPSSIFRVYTLSTGINNNFGMAYSTGFVLPLMGFWNALIYVVISWDAVIELCTGKISPSVSRDWYGRVSRLSSWNGIERENKDKWSSLNSRDDEIDQVTPQAMAAHQSQRSPPWAKV